MVRVAGFEPASLAWQELTHLPSYAMPALFLLIITYYDLDFGTKRNTDFFNIYSYSYGWVVWLSVWVTV